MQWDLFLKFGSAEKRALFHLSRSEFYKALESIKEIKDVDINDLENLIPGFTFVNGPCNPCGALNEKPDYSCSFKLNVKNKAPFISSVWQYLWNV